LTLNDLADVPSTVVSYRTLGKMFVREPLDTIRDNYGQKLETYGKELEGIEGMMRRTSDQLRQVEAQIKESSK
jgi:chaperonin cofactor prefoldin